jgi:hypothetical protein
MCCPSGVAKSYAAIGRSLQFGEVRKKQCAHWVENRYPDGPVRARPNAKSLVETRLSGRLRTNSHFVVAGAGFGTLPVVFNFAA